MYGQKRIAQWLAPALLIIACDQMPIVAPVPAGPTFNHTTTPNLQAGELLFVCKNASAPAGTYAFTLSNVAGVGYPLGLNFTLQPGECKHVASKGGTGASVTVTEVNIPNGIQLDSVQLVQATGGVAAPPQTLSGPSVTATISGVNREAATVTYFNSATPLPNSVLLLIDEDGIDNGLHYNASGGGITPSGPQFFSVLDVNDDKPGKTQRSVLRYFLNNIGRTITVRTGQTGDEGWFAPNCIPAKWISTNSSTNDTCLTGATRNNVIDNFFGKNGASAIPAESRLDKVPHVIPLRALGLNSLIGKNVCAVVYDSDLSINYDLGKPIGINGNLMGETLGIVAFTVNAVRTLNNFSSSTLPEVQITILNTSTCGNWTLFNAPVPKSSSEPNDRIAPGSTSNYYALKVWSTLGLFY